MSEKFKGLKSWFQTLFLFITVLVAFGTVKDSMVSVEDVERISEDTAVIVAERYILQAKQDTLKVDATDSFKGLVETDKDLITYLEHTKENKTRVWNGGVKICSTDVDYNLGLAGDFKLLYGTVYDSACEAVKEMQSN